MRSPMIFQDPMTSLNPVYTIGNQLMEPLQLHLGLDHKAARERAIDLLKRVGIPQLRIASITIRTSSPAACGSA